MIALIDKYFPDLTRPQRGQFEALYALYADWNTKINVISRKDFDQLYLRHVLHSLSIAKVCPFAPGARVLDVGAAAASRPFRWRSSSPRRISRPWTRSARKSRSYRALRRDSASPTSPPLRPGRNASRTVRLCGFPRRDGDADLRRLGLG